MLGEKLQLLNLEPGKPEKQKKKMILNGGISRWRLLNEETEVVFPRIGSIFIEGQGDRVLIKGIELLSGPSTFVLTLTVRNGFDDLMSRQTYHLEEDRFEPSGVSFGLRDRDMVRVSLAGVFLQENGRLRAQDYRVLVKRDLQDMKIREFPLEKGVKP